MFIKINYNINSLTNEIINLDFQDCLTMSSLKVKPDILRPRASVHCCHNEYVENKLQLVIIECLILLLVLPTGSAEANIPSLLI